MHNIVNLKLNSKYSNIIIQIGINDCAPRKIKYKLINKNDPNIGFLFDRVIPDKEFLNFINFNSDNIEEYIEYSSKNSEFIQKKYYEFYGKHNQCIDKITFQNNIELFYKNNQHLFDNVYFVSINNTDGELDLVINFIAPVVPSPIEPPVSTASAQVLPPIQPNWLHHFKDKKWLANLVAISFALPAET